MSNLFFKAVRIVLLINCYCFLEYLKNKLRPIYEQGVHCTTPWVQYFLDDTSEERPCTQDQARGQFTNISRILSQTLSEDGNFKKYISLPRKV